MSNLALRCYHEITQRFGAASETGWICGIFLNASRPGKRLSNMLQRINAGQQFATQSFKMPYTCFLLNGICVKAEILDAPVDCRIEDYRYVSEEYAQSWTLVDTSTW